MASSRRCILVLGMHRSGTSILTGILDMLGCDMPKTLMSATSANPIGYWESEPITKLNDEILRVIDSKWFDWKDIQCDVQKLEEVNLFCERAKSLIESEYTGSELFALKDPRICILAEFWIHVLKDLEIDVLFVLAFRNPASVCNSLSSRDKVNEASAMLVWARYVIQAESATRGFNRVFIDYDQLIEDWRSSINRLCVSLDVRLPNLHIEKHQKEVDQSLDSSFRHHISYGGRYLQSGPEDRFQNLYKKMKNWEQRKEEFSDYQLFDNTREYLNESYAYFGPIFEEVNRFDTYIKTNITEVDALASIWRDREIERIFSKCLEKKTLVDDEFFKKLHKSLDEANSSFSQVVKDDIVIFRRRHSDIFSIRDFSNSVDDAVKLLACVKKKFQCIDVENKKKDRSLDELRERLEMVLRGLEIREQELAMVTQMLIERDVSIDQLRTETSELQAVIKNKDIYIGRVDSDVLQLKSNLNRAFSELSRSKKDIKKYNAFQILLAELLPVQTGFFSSCYVLFVNFIRLRSRLKQHNVFDEEFYLEKNPDVKIKNISPLRHYFLNGIFKGRRATRGVR